MITVLGLLFLAIPDSTAAPMNDTAIDGTKLFTETWYTIELKSNIRCLTWAYATIPNNDSISSHHIQLEERSNKDYVFGARWWKDLQWKFIQTEETNSFIVTNGGVEKKDYWMSFAGGDSEQTFVGLQAASNDPDYQEGGKFRKKVLWKIKPRQNDKESGYYKIFQEWFPSDGIMFYDKPSGGRKFVQIYRDRNQTQSTWDNDNSLWKIEPIDPNPTSLPVTTTTVPKPKTKLTTSTVAFTQKPSTSGKGGGDDGAKIWISQALINLCLLLVMISA